MATQTEQDLKRFENAVNRREYWRTRYQEAYRYVTPNRETFFKYQKGQKKTEKQFDSTAMMALEVFVSRIMSAMFPSWQVWSYFQAGSDIPDGEKEQINKQLEDITEKAFNFINHSNFETQMPLVITDLAYGTGCMLLEEGDSNNLLKHKNIPLAELYLEEGPNFSVETVFRKHTVKARNILRQWPQATLSEDLRQTVEKNPDEDIEIITGSIYEPKEGVYRQTVIAERKKEEIYTWNEDTSPYIVPRWDLTPGEIYGRGPIIKILPDIQCLNLDTEMRMRRQALEVGGVWTAVNDGVINPYNIKLKPNTVIPVASNNNSNRSIDRLPMGEYSPAERELRQEWAMNIRKALFADDLPEIQDGIRTATEWQIRRQQMLKNSGAQLGRLRTEFVDKYMQRVIDILKRNGKIADIRIDGKDVTLKHTSPLAKEQDVEELEGLEVYLATMAQMVEPFAPGLTALTTKLEDIPRFIADKSGGINDLVRTKTETKAVGQQVQDIGMGMAEQVAGEQPQQPPLEA